MAVDSLEVGPTGIVTLSELRAPLLFVGSGWLQIIF
jgi:hypothetical protein